MNLQMLWKKVKTRKVERRRAEVRKETRKIEEELTRTERRRWPKQELISERNSSDYVPQFCFLAKLASMETSASVNILLRNI